MADLDALAAQLTSLLALYGVTRDQIADLLGGAADGGPNGDGRYPVTLANGATVLVPGPARIALLSGDTTAAVAVIQPLLTAAIAAAQQSVDARNEARDWSDGSGTAGGATPGGPGTKPAKSWAADAAAYAALSNAGAVATDTLDTGVGVRNLVDPAKINDGHYLSNGVPTANDQFFVTGPIKVRPGGFIILRNTTSFNDGTGAVAYFDLNNVFLRMGTAPQGGVPYAIPNDVNFVEISQWKAYATVGTIEVYRGSVLPPKYLSFDIPTTAGVIERVRADLLPPYIDRTLDRATASNRVDNVYIQPGDTFYKVNMDWVTFDVPVTPGGFMTVPWKTYQGIIWLDINGVRTAATVPGPTGLAPVGGYPLPIPPTAVRLKYCVEKQYLPIFQMIDGAVTLGHPNLKRLARLSDLRPLTGRKIMFKGDSTYQDQDWVERMCDALGATCINLSKGSEGIAHALSYRRSDHVNEAGVLVPLEERALTQADVMAVDVIVMSLTYNSAYFAIPPGSFDDAVPIAGSGAAMPANFIPAMRYAIRTYRAWNPDVLVLVVGTHHRYEGADEATRLACDQRQLEYYAYEQQVCREESVAYFDFMTESGLSRGTIPADWDGIHGTPIGFRRRWLKPIQGWVASKLALT